VYGVWELVLFIYLSSLQLN